MHVVSRRMLLSGGMTYGAESGHKEVEGADLVVIDLVRYVEFTQQLA